MLISQKLTKFKNKEYNKRVNKKHRENMAKPFLKWLGGKTGLIWEIMANFPDDWYNGYSSYYEPCIGGGAILLHLLDTQLEFRRKTNIYISDTNIVLLKAYDLIKGYTKSLLKNLSALQKKLDRQTEETIEDFYYELREEYNYRLERTPKTILCANTLDEDVQLVTLFIALNKLCFNGLYRINKKGYFNVPFGKKKVGTAIYDEEHLIEISNLLQDVNIFYQDILELPKLPDSINYLDFRDCLIYIDPPYRPISKTSKFTAYGNNNWDKDYTHINLCNVLKELDRIGSKWLMSNSFNEDNFWVDQFSEPNFYYREVSKQRLIAAKSENRGIIKEILIRNYQTPIGDY